MTDMIRKSDALAACQGMDPEGDINNLPAVVVGVKPLGSDGVKIHPQDILNAAWRDDLGEEGLAMYNRILSALEPAAIREGDYFEGIEEGIKIGRAAALAVSEAYEKGLRDAQSLIASIGYGKNEDVDEGHEQAFRAIEKHLTEWKAAE